MRHIESNYFQRQTGTTQNTVQLRLMNDERLKWPDDQRQSIAEKSTGFKQPDAWLEGRLPLRKGSGHKRLCNLLHRTNPILVCLALAGCANIYGPALPLGTPEAEVVARLGTPTRVYPATARQPRVLEYMTGPFGQATFMARMGPDGRLRSYEQVLTAQNFATIRVNVDTKADVLHILGAPSDTSYLALVQQEVWSYPYQENPVADSMMHVHFDDAGIVRRMLNGPDLRRGPDHQERFGFGFGRAR